MGGLETWQATWQAIRRGTWRGARRPRENWREAWRETWRGTWRETRRETWQAPGGKPGGTLAGNRGFRPCMCRETWREPGAALPLHLQIPRLPRGRPVLGSGSRPRVGLGPGLGSNSKAGLPLWQHLPLRVIFECAVQHVIYYSQSN